MKCWVKCGLTLRLKSIKERRDLFRIPAITRAVSECEQASAGRGRVLLRPSGTGPVMRVMVEGEYEQLTRSLCQELADKVDSILKLINGTE